MLAALVDQDPTLYLHQRSPNPQMLAPFLNYGTVAGLWGFQAEAGTHAIRLILSGTLDRHPNLKIVLGHLGEGCHSGYGGSTASTTGPSAGAATSSASDPAQPGSKTDRRVRTPAC